MDLIIAAGFALKSCLPGSAASFHMPASAALPAPCRLVVDEAEKLREGPGMRLTLRVFLVRSQMPSSFSRCRTPP